MADTQTAPAIPATEAGMFDDDSSVASAAEAFLGLMDPRAEDTPETEEDAAEEVTAETEAEPEVEAQADTEDEAEESETEEIEEEDDEEGPSLYAVMVDGKEETVTLDDLTSSYLRQSDYTKRHKQSLNNARTSILILPRWRVRGRRFSRSARSTLMLWSQ